MPPPSSAPISAADGLVALLIGAARFNEAGDSMTCCFREPSFFFSFRISFSSAELTAVSFFALFFEALELFFRFLVRHGFVPPPSLDGISTWCIFADDTYIGLANKLVGARSTVVTCQLRSVKQLPWQMETPRS